MQYSDEQKLIGFETYQHIWNLQRFIHHSIEEFLEDSDDYSYLRNNHLTKFMELSNRASSLKVSKFNIPNLLAYMNSVNTNVVSGDAQVDTIINNTLTLMKPSDKSFSTFIVSTLTGRMVTHDQSKLGKKEIELFTAFTPKLKTITFGSEEYKACLAGLKPALDNHYACNRHHPEHYEKGVEGMTLLDVLEMCCDWTASSLRTKDGSFSKSLEICKERFGINKKLAKLIKNTYDDVLKPHYKLDREHYEIQ